MTPEAAPTRRVEATVTAADTGLLTDAEHQALKMTADLWNHLCSAVVRSTGSRTGDLAELAGHIHAIQHAIMANAAARAYPDIYRTLGGTIR